MWLRAFLYISGAFTLTLGIIHIFLPKLLDYRTAILGGTAPVRPFNLPLTRYQTQPRDLYGIVWVMNHAASYGLITIGLLDLFATRWLFSETGQWVTLWIAGWWVVRAASQLYLGHRWGDWLILLGFLALGLVHLAVFLQ